MTLNTFNSQFFTRYKFEKDFGRPGRSLQTVKVGGVHITRVCLDPNILIGDIYYKETNLIFFVERGRIKMKCCQINTNIEKETIIHPGEAVIHIPPFTAFTFENLESDEAVLLFFSDKRIRSDDEHDFAVHKKVDSL